MRGIGICLLPLAAGSCLSDAIPAAERQNLVNANGQSYPMGFFVCNWAASYAANVLGATLVEEIFGFNTSLNDGSNGDDVGSGTISGYYGLTGCRSYNDAADRGCMQGVSYYHVGLEAWLGYPLDWEHIQNTYTSMAPKNLGTMGYTGPAGVYIPSAVQTTAYSTAGLALQYFRDFNASWNQPWNFFASISAVNTSLLAPCNKSEQILSSDAMLRRHVEFTGDLDGVIITNGTYSARCDDGFWWAAPACRGNLAHCIPHITGGTGWGLEDVMQKFTFHNMPVAVASAATWGDYTSIPLSGEKLFYWWAPDPTFLELSPLFIKFPLHNPLEYAEGKYESATTRIIVASIVSQDLAILAPTVESFIDNLDLPISHMNDMLLDQKRTGDTWRNVTCRWIKANRAMWQKWIPDESACHPGFGLYDSVLHTFTDVRMNASNKIVCQACPPGHFSKKMEDDKGATYQCLPCGPGTSQASGASLGCNLCKAGEYQDESRSTECKRCGFGTYQDQEGQDACRPCPASTSTLGLGAQGEIDCGCPASYINMDTTGGFDCVQCGEGLVCPALSQLADLQSGESRNGEQYTPKIQKGYFSTKQAATEVYRCEEANCPGGTPGSCARGLVEIPCSHCAEGETWTGSECKECAGWRQALWVLAVLGFFTLLTAVYYVTTSKVTAKASLLFSTTASFGILLATLQNLGLISFMTVEWPSSIRGIFSVCQFLLLDVDRWGFSCIAGDQESTRYFLRAMIFPVGLIWLALVFQVSQFFPQKLRWQWPKVLSTMGAVLQLGFSSISATALAPMMCYKHPNGLKSVLTYPGVICSSAEHDGMVLIAALLLVVFIFGFTALCTYIVVSVPRWSVTQQFQRVQAARFLVFRFRMDSGWWFGVPLLLRSPLLNLPVVLATDFPPVQIVCMSVVLSTMMVLQMLYWPWKVPILNVIDCVISFCIVLLVTNASLFQDTIDESMYAFAIGVTTSMLSGICGSVFLMFFMTGSAFCFRGALGTRKDIWIFNLGSLPPAKEIARKVQEFARELETLERNELAQKLEQMPVFDVQKVSACITLLASEVAPPAEGAASFKFTSRIHSSSFDPANRMKPVSSTRNRSVKKSVRKTQQEQTPLELEESMEDEEAPKSDWV